MTGASKVTILRLLESLGAACAAYQDRAMRNLTCKRIQCDEIWQFCYAKDKNVPDDKQGQFGYGSVWTWVALDAETKLIPSWRVGTRGYEFMHDLAGRLANRVQLTTDGHRVYLDAARNTKPRNPATRNKMLEATSPKLGMPSQLRRSAK
jgi:hypothetical protein